MTVTPTNRITESTSKNKQQQQQHVNSYRKKNKMLNSQIRVANMKLHKTTPTENSNKLPQQNNDLLLGEMLNQAQEELELEQVPELIDEDDVEYMLDEIDGLDSLDMNNNFTTIPNFHHLDNPQLKEPIYEGSSVSLQSFIVIMLFLIISMKIGTSKIDTFLKTINLLVPQKSNKLPSTKQQLFKHIPFMNSMQRVYYCSDCKLYCHGCKCSSCNKVCKTHFLHRSLKNQLQERCKDENFCKQLDYYKTRRFDKDIISDVFDGTVIKEKLMLNNNTTIDQLFLQINWDGASPFSSSKFSLWPIYVIVQNLPPDIRYEPDNLFMVGLWYGEEKPDEIFLNYITDDIKQVENKGITTPTSSTTWFANLCSIVCDLPAKAKIFLMTAFNGEYACGFCLNSGYSCLKRFVFPICNMVFKTTPRSEDVSRQNAKTQTNGLKGETSLFKLNTFSWTKAQTVDAMHLLCGVFRMMVNAWSSKDSPAKISRKDRTLLNTLLVKQKLPTLFKRKSRSIQDYKYWKAHEVLVFYLYLTPLLKNILDDTRYAHIQILTESLLVLFADSISKTDLAKVKVRLVDFVMQTETLYGEHCLGLNVHHLVHLCDIVERHGPLWCFTCFPYESYNKILLSFIHGTNKVEKYASNSISIFKQFKKLLKEETNHDVLEVIDQKNLHQKGNRITFNGIKCTVRNEVITNMVLNGFFYTIKQQDTLLSNNVVQFQSNRFGVIVKMIIHPEKFSIHVQEISNGMLTTKLISCSPDDIIGPTVLLTDMENKLIVTPLLKCHSLLLK